MKVTSLLAGIFSLMLIINTSCRKTADIASSTIRPQKALVERAAFYPFERIKIIHLYRDTVYTLSENFTREEGEQLIIDEGTLIKVNISGTTGGNLFASIIINPGGVLEAIGSQNQPIVFTSADYTGNQQANWGGIIIRGHSFDNSAGTTGNEIDFSGALKFVRIEFAPLMLTAVGNRTIIENVQVSYANAVSSFEFDGGTVNAKNLISYACAGSADYYLTRGYSGKLQNVIALRHPFFGVAGTNQGNTLTGLLIENNPDSATANSALPKTSPLISNLSILGPNGQDGSGVSYADTNLLSAAIVTTRNASFKIRNSYFLGFPAAGLYIGDSASAISLTTMASEFTHSLVQCADDNRVFYIPSSIYPPYTANDFKNYMLQPSFANQQLHEADGFKLTSPFNYTEGPNITPTSGSILLAPGNFEDSFNDIFFEKTVYVGAIGNVDWTNTWSNFLPLKTNYNFPH